jgi:hypothetical protein
MLEKTMPYSELVELIKEGAEVKLPARTMTVEQLDELCATLKQMAAAEETRIAADIARNQTNLEILATLQGIIRKTSEKRTMSANPAVDMQPVVDLLTELRAERKAREATTYQFDIQRDGRGFAQSIKAKPITPTTH